MRANGFKRWRSRQAGFTIVELIVAVTALTIAFSGIFSLLQSSFAASRAVTENYIATYLAAEGIEVVKNILDSNVLQGNSWSRGFLPGEYRVSYESICADPFGNCLIPHDDPVDPSDPYPLGFDRVSGLYSYSGAEPTPYFRKMVIEYGANQNELIVHATVSWKSRGRDVSLGLEDHFFNYGASPP